jgi:two-component system, sensor histidine kinase PdtaS
MLCVSSGAFCQQKQHNKTVEKQLISIEGQVKYYRYFKPDSAILLANQGIAYSRANGDSSGVAALLLQLGMIDDNNGDFEQSEIKYRTALELYTTGNRPAGIAKSKIRLGVVFLRNGSFDKAIQIFLDALGIAEKSADRFGMMEANQCIGWAFQDQKKFSVALGYLNTADSINQLLPLSNISLNIANNYGMLYRDIGLYDKAKEHLEKGIQQSNGTEYRGLQITLINSLASVYAKEGQIDKAITLQKEALVKSREIKNVLRELQTLYGLARTYDKEPNNAIAYLEEAIQLSEQKGLYNQEIRYLRAIVPLYKKKGDINNAFSRLERLQLLSDSFYYKKLSKNIASLKAEYELSQTNARVKELNLLNKQRTIELQNSTLIKRFTIAGILVLLVVCFLLGYQYRQIRRASIKIALKNCELEKLLGEKEWLMKEVHHRVKNNLQTIVSLLESQTVYLSNQDALLAIRESQNRVHTMSLLHQKLYQANNFASVDMHTYLTELINYLKDTYDLKQKIRFSVSIPHLELDISQAIPLGLIINEAVTNSIKHAFPSQINKEIIISMKQLADGKVNLRIADNGVGFKDNFDIAESKSLGLKLIEGLSGDINAEFTLQRNHGVSIMLIFEAVMASEQIKEGLLTTEI